jgi:hypothetical protein
VSQPTILPASLLLACALALVGACAPELCVGDCDGETDDTTQEELASLQTCEVQSTIDTSTCGDGVSQLGEICFESGTLIALPGDPSGALAGDFDGDGRTDVLLTDQAGTMTRLAGAAIGPLSTAVTVAQIDPRGLLFLTDVGDFDGDGALDVVGNDDRAFLLPGDGSGGFGSLRLLYGPYVVWGPTILDEDGDGDLDLAIVDPDASLDNIMLSNDGTGIFTVLPQFDDGDFGTNFPIAVGDLDGDGPYDRVTGIDSSLRFQVRGGAADTLSSLPLAADYLRARTIEISDFDDDGRSDLVTDVSDREHRNSEGFEIYSSVAVFLSDGLPASASPSFAAGTYLPMDCGMSGMTMDDVDGDGALDIVASHYAEPDSGQSASLVVRRGDGLGGFEALVRIPAPPGVDKGGDVLLGDFDGDGRMDVAVLLSTAQLVLYRGTL